MRVKEMPYLCVDWMATHVVLGCDQVKSPAASGLVSSLPGEDAVQHSCKIQSSSGQGTQLQTQYENAFSALCTHRLVNTTRAQIRNTVGIDFHMK